MFPTIAICRKCGQYVYIDGTTRQAKEHASATEDRCTGTPREMTAEEAAMLSDQPTPLPHS